MITIKNYLVAESLEEAYEANQKKKNTIIGGMGWLKLGSRAIDTAIDLSKLGLDQIEETESEIRIGAMVSLRELELHEGLEQVTDGGFREAVCHIVGVQFRNCATIGGTIYGRYGFSDILTCLLTYDTSVKLYKAGIVSLEAYASMDYDSDLIEAVIIKKTGRKSGYQAFRNQSTDLPVLTCALALRDEFDAEFTPYAVVGARPGRAVCVRDEQGLLKKGEIDLFVQKVANDLKFDTNMRAGAEYRRELSQVLLRRIYKQLLENK